MIGWLGLITTGLGLVKDISKDIRAERTRQKQLDTDQDIQASKERIADLQVAGEVQLELVKNQIVAVMHGTIQFLLGLIVVVLLFKILIIDKVFGAGSTDALDANLWNVVYIILAIFGAIGGARMWRR